ncbi:Uncaracterized surface protein containing fasciclin (FAS1) repeats [Loktanella fryxellensis]|uniref:Uncaracterized surface protein containing fasciclin (FAS1) repeats n=1 Tax=Loktanella fryxellensis TaxID=245187 RepID=A0A1H7ZY98_9RHOB|nr:fasciclin domain-containing protein [Loktanella fryxellensis]SEM63253.1 Uncaracterized surface protein containing fasciclin (FAS1) repeats [Loktanella fryxellensis]
MLRKTLMTTAALLTFGAGTAAYAQEADIVDTAVAAGNFTTLVAAVEAAGLVETLKGEGPFTVFAPTDEAFAALPEGTVEDLLLPENIDQLTAILTYHVVPGAVMAADLTDGMTAATVQGADVTIGVGDTVTVNDATVTTPDIAATNGVIHVVDSVLMPPAE